MSSPGLRQNLSNGMLGSCFNSFGSANPTLGAGAALQPASNAAIAKAVAQDFRSLRFMFLFSVVLHVAVNRIRGKFLAMLGSV
jgi:hypothetical protein